MKAIVAERGQVTIPKSLRIRLGIQPGTVLDFEVKQGSLIARKQTPNNPIAEIYGCAGKGLTDEIMKQLRGEE